MFRAAHKLYWILGAGLLGGAVAVVWLVPPSSGAAPIAIGFVGGLTGRTADLGVGGRDGALLAVEDWNERGGVGGRPVTLLVRDDAQDAERAVAAVSELADRGVAAVIGPMTSQMAVAVVPIANQRRLLVLGPAVSTNDLTGLDDWFFRIYAASARAAEVLARAIHDRGAQRVALVFDIGNEAHSRSWVDHFSRAFQALGGSVSGQLPFHSGGDVSFQDIVEQIAAWNVGAVLVIANSLDTAMLCQQLRKRGVTALVAASEWSAAEETLTYGGAAVEGLLVHEMLDRACDTARYRRFVERFERRFGREAGFAAVQAYDATNILLTALARDPEPAHLRETLRNFGAFETLQAELRFDAFGDVERPHFLVQVRDGRFVSAGRP